MSPRKSVKNPGCASYLLAIILPFCVLSIVVEVVKDAVSDIFGGGGDAVAIAATATVTVTSAPSMTLTPLPTATATDVPSATPSATVKPSATPKPPTATVRPTATKTPAPTATATAVQPLDAWATDWAKDAPTAPPSATPSATATPNGTATAERDAVYVTAVAMTSRTPTPAPTATPSEADFIAAATDILNDYAEVMGLIGEVYTQAGNNPAIILDEQWRTDTELCLAILHHLEQRVYGLTAPPRYEPAWAEVRTAATHYSEAATLMEEAIQEVDAQKMFDAQAPMLDGHAAIQRATALWPSS